jgi:hypothetical protein
MSRSDLLRRTDIRRNALKGVLSSLTRNAMRITNSKHVRVIEQGSDGKSYSLVEPLLSFVKNEINGR